ncbi:conserved hypothetical protein [Pseudomonas sp. 8Z]|nr:conserved hypothetical protein [Pseudomonas sp. 8Z]
MRSCAAYWNRGASTPAVSSACGESQERWLHSAIRGVAQRNSVGGASAATIVAEAPPTDSALELFHAFSSTEQQQIRRAGGEQAVGDHADDGVYVRLQLDRIGDRHVVHVEDDVAVVGQHAFTVHGVAAQFHQLTGDMAARHGNHFHRQREFAQHRHQLAGVGDADEGLGHGGDDLLAGQRGAAAFDQVQVFVALVGAVDVKLQVADGVEVVHRDAMALQACGGGFGTGHGAVELHLVLSQCVDEEVGGRAGADTDDALAVEARENVVDGGLGHSLFQLILVHREGMPGRVGDKARIIAASGVFTGQNPRALYGRAARRWGRLGSPLKARMPAKSPCSNST